MDDDLLWNAQPEQNSSSTWCSRLFEQNSNYYMKELRPWVGTCFWENSQNQNTLLTDKCYLDCRLRSCESIIQEHGWWFRQVLCRSTGDRWSSTKGRHVAHHRWPECTPRRPRTSDSTSVRRLFHDGCTKCKLSQTTRFLHVEWLGGHEYVFPT